MTLEIQSTIDSAALTTVVRQDQSDPAFEVLDWQVETLSVRGAVNPDGLLRVSGHGRGREGGKAWTVALKIVKQPAEEVAPSELGYWQREANAYRSGLLASLPGPVQPARCYDVSERDGAMWIWMELLTDSAGRTWDLTHYAFAADQLGRFNGACATGIPLPDAPWLARGHTRVWHALTNFEQAWQNQQVRQTFPAPMSARLLALWAERERFYTALDHLPQIFSHFDYKRANLFIRQRADNQREVVAVDWGDCGVGALGGDLGLLVGGSAFFFDWEPEQVLALSTIAYDAYLQGLYASGWRGNEDHIRLAYTTWMAMYFGPPVAAGIHFVLQEELRADTLRLLSRSPEQVPQPFLALCEFSLDCADEARRLMANIDR